ncbi:sulfatase-like hydrolase/transferase [Bacillaceae bacterium SIJ1]|uniref:sulfatase-like hydrolase/transferase n=1 Tax=Litoribacterium kuwaitense TaxID=1398745 RepID=UPI0013EABA05|nr:sulfatase-like hydrolase/transferase [Litoribacterium kuwaitense]NGP45443.1 sulfatase-like hydrolase/transferase [Litoribacterium kuwaitense]
MERPNIVWISLEDTSPRFGCYGDDVARTPHIDRLASEGTVFTQAFATAGVCAPSRSAIITGMYQTSIGTHHMRTTHTNVATPELPTPYEAVVPHYVKAFTEYLRAAGYYCTNNKKTDYQFHAPFTAWDELGDQAHWRNRKEGQPFFSVFNPTLTHESGMWPEKERHPLETDPNDVELPPYLPDTLKCREALARHYDNIADSDNIVGDILQQLEDDGLRENTIVFLWSDHGEGLPRAKRWPYDAGIRIPLIVRWPGQVASKTVSDQLVSLVDLAPTVLSLAGINVPAHLEGQSFLGDDAVGRDYIFATRDRYDESYDMVRAIRDDQFKYIRHYDPNLPYLLWIPYQNKHPVQQELWRLYAAGKLEDQQRILFNERAAEELYDLQNDPHEVNNLAANPVYQERLETMRLALDEWRQRTGDLGELSETELVERFWPGGVQPETAVPLLIPVTEDDPGVTPSEGGTFKEPFLLQLHCATQGASIAYTLENGADARWELYTKPLLLTEHTTTIRVKASRIGYKDSHERTSTFTIRVK